MYGAWVEGEHPGASALQRAPPGAPRAQTAGLTTSKPDGAALGHELSLWVVLLYEQLAP
ncbi:hypothetical protein [Streptomyces sp. CBG33]|uniref:hypothetical protein n=1 Tax=Streptomyces sp. CBG33 TaxID=2762624 RepID=UPI001648F2A4|nr:hypothetical protein [Streptomyces sp. CBG33]